MTNSQASFVVSLFFKSCWLLFNTFVGAFAVFLIFVSLPQALFGIPLITVAYLIVTFIFHKDEDMRFLSRVMYNGIAIGLVTGYSYILWNLHPWITLPINIIGYIAVYFFTLKVFHKEEEL